IAGTVPFGGVPWKLLLQELRKLFALGELFKAAPVITSVAAQQGRLERTVPGLHRSTLCQLSVTRTTTGQGSRTLNVVFLHQRRPLIELVPWGLPIHAKHIFPRPDISFGLAMAIKAPFHLERSRLPGQGHQVHPSVTGGAA